MVCGARVLVERALALDVPASRRSAPRHEIGQNENVADTFASRFAAVRPVYGPLAWGLDPSGAILEEWGVGDTPDGLDRFADLVLSAAVGTVGLVKPQAAFYERHGWRGFRTLERLIAEARSAGLLVIVDAKRGDVGTTNDAYAEAFLGVDAPLGADALTVHPYLGVGAMGAFVTRAHESGSCLLVVTRSSNPDGRMVQSARTGCGRSVEEDLLVEIGEINRDWRPGRSARSGRWSVRPTWNRLSTSWPSGVCSSPPVSVPRAPPRPTWPGSSPLVRIGSSPAPPGRCCSGART